jgi:hypothetical protein
LTRVGESVVRPRRAQAVERWSPLTLAIASVLDRIAPVPLSDETRDLLEVVVEDHGLSGPSPPGWMVGLFGDILARRTTRPRRWVPDGYPMGEMGLANVLADIEQELFALGVDDYGEGVVWPIPGCGVRVVVIRESSAPGPWVYLERLAR